MIVETLSLGRPKIYVEVMSVVGSIRSMVLPLSVAYATPSAVTARSCGAAAQPQAWMGKTYSLTVPSFRTWATAARIGSVSQTLPSGPGATAATLNGYCSSTSAACFAASGSDVAWRLSPGIWSRLGPHDGAGSAAACC